MEKMELKDFIKEAILQIADGVIEAREELKGKDILINPAVDENGNAAPLDPTLNIEYRMGSRPIQTLEINVGVYVGKSSGSKKGITLLTHIVQGGAGFFKTSDRKSVNNLKFTVPISLPYDNNK